MSPGTICALLYGDYLPLAQRCLESWEGRLPPGVRVRLGLSQVCQATRSYALGKARQWSQGGIPVAVFEAPTNPGKYPLMRRMLYGGPANAWETGEFIVWFDDDSYFDFPVGDRDHWWDQQQERLRFNSVIGQRWHIALQGLQREWIASRPWGRQFSPKEKQVAFPQGGWWIARTALLRTWDWPDPQLHHRGGDVMLGVLLAIQRIPWLSLGKEDLGVRINADDKGRHSGSVRRGLAPPPIGLNGPFQPLPGLHEFPCEVTLFDGFVAGQEPPPLQIPRLRLPA